MLGITVPDRASWIRTAMAELGRAIHHLRWLGETIGELGAAGADPVAAALREDCRTARERLTWLQEANSGGRIHPMLVVPGGVREDVPAGWTGQTGELVGELTGLGAALTDWIDSQQQLAAVGVLPADAAVRWATSGPVARGSGAELDLRIDEPYLTYRQLAEQGVLRAVVETGGGVQARLRVLAGELQVSLDCLVAAAADLADPALTGPVSVRLPRSLRVPEGSGYGWTENPTGINGWYLVSRGGTSPYRLKLRTASFNNAQALAAVVVGQPVADLTVTLMSFLLVAGDLAK
jgi:NADH-quinone oxidoreductase subunit D